MSETLIADLKRQLAAERDHGKRLQMQLDAILRTDSPPSATAPLQWDSEMAHAGYDRARQSDIQWVASSCAACGAIYESMVKNYLERQTADQPCVDCGAIGKCAPGCPSRLPLASTSAKEQP